jgi:hypothetical protein
MVLVSRLSTHKLRHLGLGHLDLDLRLVRLRYHQASNSPDMVPACDPRSFWSGEPPMFCYNPDNGFFDMI